MMEALKGKGVELTAIGLTGLIQLIAASYMYGQISARVAILEQLRAEARVDISTQLADIKGQIADTNRKLDRVLEKR